MITKLDFVTSIWILIFSCSLISASRGQDAEKEVRGLINDALGESKDAVAINDSNTNRQLRLDGKRCVVNGASNQIQITGECSELIVNGTGNRIRIEKVEAIRVLGANNSVTYDHGVSTAKPERVRILGAGSTVVQSGTVSKNEDQPNKTEPNQPEGSAAPITIAANNSAHLTRTIADQSPVAVSGNNNVIEITGKASVLTVRGNNNQVSIDGVARVIFKGSNNVVSYKTGDNPLTTSSGFNNIVTRR
jgi:hypothetical protein